MRKNKMLRMASALLMLVLLTTSVVGGTFAKYTTSADTSDTARVAKWGVMFEETSDLFAESYKDPTNTNVTVNVETTGTNLVAPGTNGTGLGVKTKGTPEVSYVVTIKLDADNAKVPTLKYTSTDGTVTTYEPVKFSVYNGDTKIKENMSLSEMKDTFNGTKVIYKYDVSKKQYCVDSDLDGNFDSTSTTTAPEIKIKWEWPFETGDNDIAKTTNNKLDTFLGDAAAGSNPTLPTDVGTVTTDSTNTQVNLSWTMTATQID